MSIRNTTLGGATNWSDGEVLYATDLNDTFDAILNPSVGFFGGGTTGSYSNVIDTMAMIFGSFLYNTATDKGNLTVARQGLAGVNGSDYGFFGGGHAGSYSNVIDYIDITTTTGNATDKGDLTVARGYLAGVSGSDYGFFGGGYTGSYSNVIDYIDITTTTGNATDKGDLTVARRYLAGVST
jgi:hypothetical protein